MMKPVAIIPLLMLTACYTPPSIAPAQIAKDVSQGNYKLDPAHASVTWSLKHAGLSNYTARFNTISGSLDFDPKNPQNSKVDIVIDPASISTGDAEFDKEIAYKSNYFNAEKFTQIRFVSTSIIKTGGNTGDNKGQVIGELTFLGQTRSVTLDTVFNGAGKSFGHKGKTLGFSARTTLKRSDFGLTHLIKFGIGDKVTLRIEAEFNEA